MGNRIVHVEITADDPERAAGFYRRTFGWTITNWGGPVPYWLCDTGDGPGINGAIMARERGQAVVGTIQVDDPLEDVIQRVVEAGGRQVGDVAPIPGVGRVVYATDTEGNVFGILQPEPSSGGASGRP